MHAPAVANRDLHPVIREVCGDAPPAFGGPRAARRANLHDHLAYPAVVRQIELAVPLAHQGEATDDVAGEADTAARDAFDGYGIASKEGAEAVAFRRASLLQATRLKMRKTESFMGDWAVRTR